MLKDLISGLGNMHSEQQPTKCNGKDEGDVIARATNWNTASRPTESSRVNTHTHTRELL